MEKIRRLVDIMSSSISMDKPSLNMLATIKEITGAHRVYIYLFDIQQEFLHVIADKEDIGFVAGYDIVPRSHSRVPGLIRDLKPFIVEDFRHPRPGDGIAPQLVEDGNLSSITVPIISANELLGVLPLIFNEYRTWNEHVIGFFSAIGNIIGTAVKIEMTSEKVQELAIIQERRRLSQDLHDNFSQMISALSMRAEAARLTCDEGKFDKVETDLDRIIATIHEIQDILRDEMISLRSNIVERTDLLPLIRDRIQRFQQLSNITIIFEDTDIQKPIIVPTLIGAQFIRILQECLSNVRRHSQASQVAIRIGECSNRLCLEIEDNGRGFDLTAIPEDRLGLQIIRERAQEVGGKARIRSTPGKGAQILVELPIFPMTVTENEK
jgi:signal transduction histidine kinase